MLIVIRVRSVPYIAAFYEMLVPSELTHEEFWNRYFYRVDQLKMLEAKRLQAKKGNVSRLFVSNAESAITPQSKVHKPKQSASKRKWP